MLIFSGCVWMHACTCIHLRASAHHPSHQLVVWHHVTMAPGLWRPVEACSTMPTTHTQKQEFSLAFREREHHANSGSQAGEPSIADTHIHTGASVIHASGGLRSGELTSLDRHRHSTEQRNLHSQECSAAFREREEENGWRHWTFVYCFKFAGFSPGLHSLRLMRLENVQVLWRKQTHAW